MGDGRVCTASGPGRRFVPKLLHPVGVIDVRFFAVEGVGHRKSHRRDEGVVAGARNGKGAGVASGQRQPVREARERARDGDGEEVEDGESEDDVELATRWLDGEGQPVVSDDAGSATTNELEARE
jgi:hypothetical protein